MISSEMLPNQKYLENTWWISIEVCHFLRISNSQLKIFIKKGIVKKYKLGNSKSRNYFKSDEIKKLIK